MTQEVCPHCGASLKKYWHKLTPGLVKGLVKFYSAVVSKGENRVHLLKDMTGNLELTPHEWNNWTKLRFHGLVAKVDKKSRSGYWLLTRRGAEFLKGRIEIPHRVQTFRNKVVAHDSTKIFVKDVLNIEPYFESYEDFKNQLDFMDLPDELIKAPEVRTVIKRGKKEFCSCGGKVQTKIVPMGVNDEGAMRVDRKKICQKCQFEFEGNA